MFVYLARPIDQANINGTVSWLDTLTDDLLARLALATIGAYRPDRAFFATPTDQTHCSFIDEVNGRALFAADAVIAILPEGIPTLGVPAEIETALYLNKPTLILSDIKASVQLSQWKSRGATLVYLGEDALPSARDLNKLLLTTPDGDPYTGFGSEPANGLNTMLVKYDKGALPLTKAHPGDAGFDVAILEDAILHYGERTLLKTGVRASIPDGFYGRLTGRVVRCLGCHVRKRWRSPTSWSSAGPARPRTSAGTSTTGGSRST